MASPWNMTSASCLPPQRQPERCHALSAPPKKKVATNGYRPQMMAWLCLVQVIPNKATSETAGSSCGNPDSFQSRFGHSSEERRKSSKVCFNHIVDSMQSESSIERVAVTSSNHSLSELQLVYKLHKVPSSCDVKRWCDIHLRWGMIHSAAHRHQPEIVVHWYHHKICLVSARRILIQ